MDHPERPRIGRMPRWQRWTTWIVVGACLVSGLAYLVAMDGIDGSPRTLSFWWIAHGTSSLVALAVIGGAATSHALIAWRARRGRRLGLLNVVTLATLAVTAVFLFYGWQSGRGVAAWIHSAVGVVAFVAFPAHVWRGRRRSARDD